MPGTKRRPPEGEDPGRTDAARATDHAAIDRLAEELLPALVAKLSASGLGEIEVREGAWKVRLRRPVGAGGGTHLSRRVTDRPSRPQPGHTGHGHAPGALEGHRSMIGRDGHATLAAVGPGWPASSGTPAGAEAHRAIATSPAVGIFQPRSEMRAGTRVRAGDRLGFVDVLGVRQEVVSPVDGIVGATLAEGGDAVEYGQELVRLELTGGPASAAATAAANHLETASPGVIATVDGALLPPDGVPADQAPPSAEAGA